MPNTYIAPEVRAKVISAINDEGMSVPDAAKTFNFQERTIYSWLKKKVNNGHTSSTEVERLRKELQITKLIIANLVIEKESRRKSP